MLHRIGIFSEIKEVIAKIALMSFYVPVVPVRYYVVLLTAPQTSHISHTMYFTEYYFITCTHSCFPRVCPRVAQAMPLGLVDECRLAKYGDKYNTTSDRFIIV